jgi:hypothetical protein
MFSKVLAAGLLALVPLIAGCNDSVPTNPDTAPPLAPQITNAYAKVPNKVVLAWAPGTESDLAGYNVYRMGPPTRINAALVPSPSFVEDGVPTGTARYRVTAVDRSGNESAFSQVVSVSVGARTASDESAPGSSSD